MDHRWTYLAYSTRQTVSTAVLLSIYSMLHQTFIDCDASSDIHRLWSTDKRSVKVVPLTLESRPSLASQIHSLSKRRGLLRPVLDCNLQPKSGLSIPLVSTVAFFSLFTRRDYWSHVPATFFFFPLGWQPFCEFGVVSPWFSLYVHSKCKRWYRSPKPNHTSIRSRGGRIDQSLHGLLLTSLLTKSIWKFQ